MSNKIHLVCWCLVFLSACGIQKKADDMAQTSDDIHGDTSHMADGMAATKRGLSMAESFRFTDELIDKLYGAQITRESGEYSWNGEARMVHLAGAYVQGLYFQFWDGGFREDVRELDFRIYLSLHWMITRVREFIPAVYDINSSGTDRIFKASASLGAELHLTQPGFDDAVKAAGLPPLNLYRVIVDSLRQCFDKDPNYVLPKSRTEVCTFKHEFVYLLQLRHNYLPMLMLSQTTDFTDRSLINRAYTLKQGPGSDLKTILTPDMITPDALHEWASWLDLAKQTREDLRSICETPIMNDNYKAFVDMLQLTLGFTPTHGAKSELARAQTQFQQALASIRAPDDRRPFNSKCK